MGRTSRSASSASSYHRHRCSQRSRIAPPRSWKITPLTLKMAMNREAGQSVTADEQHQQPQRQQQQQDNKLVWSSGQQHNLQHGGGAVTGDAR